MKEDWAVLASLLPDGWRELARSSGALRRLRGFASVDALLRVLLLHVGHGLSLREAAAEAEASGLASVSDVALLKRFRAAEGWFREMCLGLIDDLSLSAGRVPVSEVQFRFVDATHIAEPGRTGGLWRLHYALDYPKLCCGFSELTSAKGAGVGEGFYRFPVQPGQCLVGDRAYCTRRGIASVTARGGDVLVRHHPFRLPLQTPDGDVLDLEAHLAKTDDCCVIQDIACQIARSSEAAIPGRLILIKRSRSSTARTIKQARRKAAKNKAKLQDRTLVYAGWFMLFTTLPKSTFPANSVAAHYRARWQIELAFKRMKSLAKMGHIPKRDPSCVRAWIFGKLLLALLIEKLTRHGETLSPWGYGSPSAGVEAAAQPVA